LHSAKDFESAINVFFTKWLDFLEYIWRFLTIVRYNVQNFSSGLCLLFSVRSPAEVKDFSRSLCVQTSSEAHPASYPMGAGGPFPGGRARLGRDTDHSPHLVLRSRMSRSDVSSFPWHLHGGSGTAIL
jgi:hypothetical protein